MRAAIRLIVVFAVVTAAGWYGWRWMFPDDEAAIRAVLGRIEEGVSAGGAGNGNMERLARAASLRDELAPDITVDAGPPFQRLTGRDAIIGTAASLRGSTRDLQVRFQDVEVTVAPSGERAEVTLTAEARTRETADGGLDSRELEVIFRRLDGRWVVANVTLIRALEPLGGRP
jgi:SnoaL-like domain